MHNGNKWNKIKPFETAWNKWNRWNKISIAQPQIHRYKLLEYKWLEKQNSLQVVVLRATLLVGYLS
ncbi:hypothetical protein [Mucilaginibacter sp. OK098]|uniref:hypothetical protein n=1 Tax=Mucilaginibacter sp. OK098 TaxID=1855297 RepID=UPI0009336618|nr:hypothetical protein [Mucilaginibacter sp. OK098]